MTSELGASSKVVLVTGAAGGLGRNLVREFLDQGWRVAAGYHRAHSFVSSGDLWPVPLDVTDGVQVEEVVGRIEERWKRIDVLVNNAGLTADQFLGRISEEQWDRVLGVNLKGAFLCSRAVMRPMLRQGDGHIINISSWSGRTGQRGQANYAAAKAGLMGWASALAREVGFGNVRVNSVLPGVLPTPMTASLGPEALRRMASDNVLGRLNSADEVARFAVFLASMQNVSGQVFQLDSRIAKWT